MLGLASQEEVREVETAAAQYPEVRKEIETLRDSLDKYAAAHQTAPPAHLKNKILNEIGAGREDKQEAKVVSMQPPQQSGSARWLAAASVVLLLISGALNVIQYNKLHEANERIADLQAEQTMLANEFNVLKANYAQKETDLALVSSPLTVTIQMKGVEKHPDALASIYWDTRTKEVYVGVKNLPAPPADKQYQLWAIIDGKPVDIGVFDVTDTVQKMRVVETAQAFAVTLEQKGGSAVPTLEQMFVVGNVGG